MSDHQGTCLTFNLSITRRFGLRCYYPAPNIPTRLCRSMRPRDIRVICAMNNRIHPEKTAAWTWTNTFAAGPGRRLLSSSFAQSPRTQCPELSTP